MDNPNPIRYSDLIAPDSSITDLIAQLDALIAKYDAVSSKIQSDAAAAAKSMQSLSGATEEQRKAILENTEASDRLAQEYTKLAEQQLAAKTEKAKLTAASREEAQIAKLVVQYNNSAEGSYNKLSAQYRLNKIALNEMSEAQRKNTEYGRKLEAETKAIYEEMNRLQKATGKSQLQVGQYERSLGNLIGVKTQYIEVLTDSTKRSEVFHGVLNLLKSPIAILIGVIGGLTAAFKLWIASAHETQTTGDALDREMAGWSATWDLFKKSVASVDFSLFIRGAIDAMNAGRELKRVLDETFERTNSTRLLKASMSVENAALEEAARNTKLSYEERLAAADQYLANMQPIYEQETETAKRTRDAQLEYLFSVTNKRQFASEEARKAAQEEFAENIKNYNLNEDLIKQAMEYNKAQKTISQGMEGMYGTSYDAQRKIVNNASEAVKAFAGFAEQYGLTNDKQVKAYVDAEEAYLNAQSAVYNDQKRFVTMRNSLEAQQTQEAERNARERAAAAKKAADDAVKAEQDKQREQERLAKEEEQRRQQAIADERAYMQAQLQSIQLEIANTNEWSQQMLDLRIAAINKQRDIEIFENQQKAEKLRQDEAAINKKYDAQVMRETANFNTKLAERDLAALMDLNAAENDLLDQNERQRTIFRLEQEKFRLQKILEMNETAADKMTDLEVEAVKKTIEGIEKEIGRTGYNNLYELLGLNLTSEQQSALQTAFDSVKDSIDSIMDSWKAAADAAVESANRQVESAQKVLDAEIEARNAGYANNVDMAKKELDLAKKNQQEALREQQKAQRAQLAADSIAQSSSLVTASANIWKALSGIPTIGPALAVAAIATMWGSFTASKIKAAQVTTEQYGDGTVELLQGGSHASGHDIDLGTKPNGTRRRAEGGEYFAIINKRNSRRFGHIIPDVINSFNDGTFADKYQRANAAMAGAAIGIIGGTDVSGLERDVAAIRKQGDESRMVDGDGNTIIKYKNLTRKIYKN
jgi:hypothetical protein